MEVTVSMFKIVEAHSTSGTETAWHPASWYLTNGFSADHVENIKINAPKRWDGTTQDYEYQKATHVASAKDVERTGTHSDWRPEKTQPKSQVVRIPHKWF